LRVGKTQTWEVREIGSRLSGQITMEGEFRKILYHPIVAPDRRGGRPKLYRVALPAPGLEHLVVSQAIETPCGIGYY